MCKAIVPVAIRMHCFIARRRVKLIEKQDAATVLA